MKERVKERGRRVRKSERDLGTTKGIILYFNPC